MWPQGVHDLIAMVTIVQPLTDLTSGTHLVKKEALAYLRQEGLYKRSPFTPPEWITEALGTMTPEQIEALKKCKSKGEAYRLLYEHRHSRLYKTQPRKKGRRVWEEVQKERLRLAPHMTAAEFAKHFHVCLAYAYAWNDRHGRPLRKSKVRGKVASDQEARLRAAPGMTPAEFADHFNITLQAAYSWNKNNGFLLRKKNYARRTVE